MAPKNTNKIEWKFNVSLWAVLGAVLLVVWLIIPHKCDITPKQPNRKDLYSPKQELLISTTGDTVIIAPQEPDIIIHGSGEYSPDTIISPEDTISVEVYVSVGDNEPPEVVLEIDSIPVEITGVEWYSREVPERNWQVIFSITNSEIDRFGAGVAYRFAEISEVNLSISGTVGLTGKWISPELRMSKNVWSGVAIGAGFGYRFGSENAPHFSANISLEL